jgi:ParB-like chromosome segregation protein Spo0J
MTETTNKYQVMPPLSDEEYQALKEDIAENGVLVPVVKDTDGNIIDGHHRVWAYEKLRAEGRAAGGYPVVERSGMPDQEKRDLAWRLNMQRRHLNRAQKHEAIERKLKESPEWADNRIAHLLGVDGKTVRFVRVQLEGRKEIAKVKKVVGADGKEYPRELEKSLKDKGLSSTFAKGFAQAATPDAELTRDPEYGAGELRWPQQSDRTFRRTGSQADQVEEEREERARRELQEKKGAEGEDAYDYAQSLMAKAKEGNEEIAEIVQIRVAEYLVRRNDGNTLRVTRKVLLDQGWKKCPSCKGLGVEENGEKQ